MEIATRFDLAPLSNGNVLIEFYGEDCKTINTQVVTAEVVVSMPLVAVITGVVLREGADAVKEILAMLTRLSQEGIWR